MSFDDIPPEEREWLKKAMIRTLKPMNESEIFTSVWWTGDHAKDAICCLQFGMAMMLDKPITLIVMEGCVVPENLRKVAVAIEYVKTKDPEEGFRAMKRIHQKVDAWEKARKN